MKYRIANDSELNAFINKHVRELGHTAHGVKGPPPAGATYSDGKPIIHDINVEWVCSCGESCKIINEEDKPTALQEECARLDQAVDIFAQRMKEKLHKKAAAGFIGWDDTAFEPIIKGKFIERAHRLHEGDTSQAVDVANLAMMLFTQAGPDPENNCICYACGTAGHNGGDEQCACEDIPVFDAVRCGSCKHKAACDVALHPELYPDATRGEEARP
jgi:hypothetical protein